MSRNERRYYVKIRRFDEIFRMVTIVVSFVITASSVNVNLPLLLIPLFLWSIGHGIPQSIIGEFSAKLMAWLHLSFIASTSLIKAALGVHRLDLTFSILGVFISAILSLMVFYWFKGDLDEEEAYSLQKKLTMAIMMFSLLIYYLAPI